MVGALLRKYQILLVLLPITLLMPGRSNAEAKPGDAITKNSRKVARSTSLEATPSAVSFLDVPAGATYSQSVKLTNVGEATLQIKQIEMSNVDFRVSGVMLPVVVAHGTSESFTIAYRGKREGNAQALVRILTNSGELVMGVKASGNKGSSELTANEAGIDFEDVGIGNVRRKEVILTNSGNRELSIERMSVAGQEFSVSGAGAVKLNAGQSVSVGIDFGPKSIGERSENFVVTSTAGETVLDLPIRGTGAASSDTAVRLNWEESPVSVAGYMVYRAAEPSGPYTRISSAAVSSLEFVDTGLAAGHTYYYVVSSLGADDVESEYSSPIVATVPVA
jgi:hypothetical protein